MRPPLSLLLACWCTGCGLFQQLDVKAVATSFQKPSNVAAYVAVTDQAEPLTELGVENFRVYENEQLVAAEQTRLTLLERNTAAAHHLLLLIDMSGALTLTKEARTTTVKAALGFVDKVSQAQSLSLFAFDGGEQLVPIAEIARGARLTSLPALEGFSPRDSSRNLNGAVASALAKLDGQLLQTGKPVKLGTLVVFARGPDIAGRVAQDKLSDLLSESPHDVLLVGIAEQADELSGLSRRGVVRAQSLDTLPIAFEEAADKALGELGKHYLVSYCSPARAGTRRLRLEVSYTTKQGDEHQGDFETDFDASGFGPGCDPNTPPRFVAQAKAKPTQRPADASEKGRSRPPATKPAPSTGQPPADGDDDTPVAPPDQPGYAK